ncbi:hypothetical protein FHX10_004528 [Rhizobium sp. BK591]|uniref:hypothetical protein n=1 Tax=Rhizobium sp. BK591 TaxID=2586985 RepID=UPI0016222914|nr:hypothetical protein [Rhizobium sp. BK591]MBB3744991.1 hypothetical protein [Rhizobium sp. BK591]
MTTFLETIGASLRWAYTAFGFRDRPATWPAKIVVAELRPTADDMVMALDISPGPNAAEHPDNGWAWVDVMNRSTQEPEGAPSHSLRLGVKDGVVEVGSRAWNGAGVRAVHLILDRTVAMRLELDANNKPLITCYGPIRATSFVQIPANSFPPT